MLKLSSFIFFVLIHTASNAQPPALEKDIRARLATVDLANRVILSTDTRLAAWAAHYEVLFDSFSSPFDSNQANALIEKYAAERVFVAADYTHKSLFLNWATNHNLMVFELPNLDKDANFFLNDPQSSQMIADALRQIPDSTKIIWWIMGAGVVAGVLFYIIFGKKIRVFLSKNSQKATF